MKRLLMILFSAGLMLSFACNSNKEETKEKKETKKDETISASAVPAPVKTSFSTKYPAASDVVWESASEENAPTYKAKFMLNGKKWKAEYAADGILIKEKEDD